MILDADLAALYGVSTKRLNEQVKRNGGRFPEDFMFQLTADEKAEVVANCDHLSRLKFSPKLPYAFTEQAFRFIVRFLITAGNAYGIFNCLNSFDCISPIASSINALAP